MKNFDATFLAALKEKTIRPALLVEMDFSSAALRLWTGYGQLDWNEKIFEGGGPLVHLTPVEETQEVAARGLKGTLSGIPSSMISIALNEQYQGKPFRLYMALFEKDTDTFISDPELLFRGLMDVMSIQESGQTATIEISIENRLIELKRTRDRRYTHEDQQFYYPQDKGLEYVADLQNREIKWGRS